MFDTILISDASHRAALPSQSIHTALTGDGSGLWPAAEVDPLTFREALGRFATGVTVVTSGRKEGRVAGLTASAFTSVSLDPPLVLVCIDSRSRSIDVLRETGRFAVHILRADQDRVARAFAQRGEDKLKDVAFLWSRRDIPTLQRYLVLLECDLVAEYEGGDHGIFLGRVARLDVPETAADPLTCFRGQLGALRHVGA